MGMTKGNVTANNIKNRGKEKDEAKQGNEINTKRSNKRGQSEEKTTKTKQWFGQRRSREEKEMNRAKHVNAAVRIHVKCLYSSRSRLCTHSKPCVLLFIRLQPYLNVLRNDFIHL